MILGKVCCLKFSLQESQIQVIRKQEKGMSLWFSRKFKVWLQEKVFTCDYYETENLPHGRKPVRNPVKLFFFWYIRFDHNVTEILWNNSWPPQDKGKGHFPPRLIFPTKLKLLMTLLKILYRKLSYQYVKV